MCEYVWIVPNKCYNKKKWKEAGHWFINSVCGCDFMVKCDLKNVY